MAKTSAEETLVEYLEYLINCSKQCLMSEVIRQAMPILKEAGFEPKYLIEGLADFFDEQGLDEVVGHLETVSRLLDRAKHRSGKTEPSPLEADMN